MSMDIEASDEKLAELLLLIADGLRDEPSAGATKLNKLAFYAEFTHFRTTGRPITGVEYQRLPNGPAPRRLLPVRERLLAEGHAEIREESYLGHVQHRLAPKRAPNAGVFSKSELSAINEVLTALGDMSGSALSELSHQEPVWNLVADGDTIPFETALLRSGRPGPRAVERGRRIAAQYKASR